MEDLKKSFLVKGDNIIGALGDKNFSTAPLGTVLSFAGQTAPHGYLLCDGASYKVADYPYLYAVIGNTYGGDDVNFNVPDYRETVLVGVGENTTDTIASHDVYELGEFKDDQLQGHWHILGNSNGVITVALGASARGGSVMGANPASETRYTVENALDAITDGTNGEPRVGTTTHGKQKGVTYIIKAFHTNEGVDSGVSDDVVEYVEGKIATVETALPNIKKFANPGGTAKYITISGATLGDIEVHSAYAGKYMFTSSGSTPIFFGTSTYLGYTLTGWAWSSDKTKLYLRVNGHRDFIISAFGSDGVEISDMTTTAPTDVTFNATFNYNAYIDNSSTGDATSTWSSSKIAEYVAENAAPSYSGTVTPTSIANGVTVTTDWDISSAGSNADYGRLLMLNSSAGTFLIHVKGNLGNTSTVSTPTVVSSIANSQGASWSSSFELSISSGKLRIKNKSGAAASWRFV